MKRQDNPIHNVPTEMWWVKSWWIRFNNKSKLPMSHMLISRNILWIEIVFFVFHLVAGTTLLMYSVMTTLIVDVLWRDISLDWWQWELIRQNLYQWIIVTFIVIIPVVVGTILLGILTVMLHQGRQEQNPNKLKWWWKIHAGYAALGHISVIVLAAAKTRLIFYEIPFVLFLGYRVWSIVKVYHFAEEIERTGSYQRVVPVQEPQTKTVLSKTLF